MSARKTLNARRATGAHSQLGNSAWPRRSPRPAAQPADPIPRRAAGGSGAPGARVDLLAARDRRRRRGLASAATVARQALVGGGDPWGCCSAGASGAPRPRPSSGPTWNRPSATTSSASASGRRRQTAQTDPSHGSIEGQEASTRRSAQDGAGWAAPRFPWLDATFPRQEPVNRSAVYQTRVAVLDSTGVWVRVALTLPPPSMTALRLTTCGGVMRGVPPPRTPWSVPPLILTSRPCGCGRGSRQNSQPVMVETMVEMMPDAMTFRMNHRRSRSSARRSRSSACFASASTWCVWRC